MLRNGFTSILTLAHAKLTGKERRVSDNGCLQKVHLSALTPSRLTSALSRAAQ